MEGGFDFDIIIQSIPYLAEGMVLTFQLALLGVSGGLIFGTLLALCRLAPFAPLSFAAGSYVNFFRSMPLILVIFWFYFLVPLIVGRPVGG
ncbi:MAG: ABC transporter permease subunit, partial [Rhodospirillales bacterium]